MFHPVTRAYTVVLSRDPNNGAYTASCPALPGAVTEGDTREEALAAMVLVAQAWLDLGQRAGRDPLEETPELIAADVRDAIAFRLEEGWEPVIETEVVRLPVAAAA